MAAIYSDNINYVGNKPNFERDRVKTLAQLLAEDPAKRRYPFGHIVFCEEDNNHYKFNYNYNDPGATSKNSVTGWFEKVVALSVSQTTGNNTGAVMSQAAVSSELKKTNSKIAEHSTVRFDRIEENEATINAGEIGSTPTAIVYYKPANKFVAADSAGNYWDTWDGMEAYMSSGKIREDKVYLFKAKHYTFGELPTINQIKLSNGTQGNASNAVAVVTPKISCHSGQVCMLQTNRPNRVGCHYVYGIAVYKSLSGELYEGYSRNVIDYDYRNRDNIVKLIDGEVGCSFVLIEVDDNDNIHPLRHSDFENYNVWVEIDSEKSLALNSVRNIEYQSDDIIRHYSLLKDGKLQWNKGMYVSPKIYTSGYKTIRWWGQNYAFDALVEYDSNNEVITGHYFIQLKEMLADEILLSDNCEYIRVSANESTKITDIYGNEIWGTNPKVKSLSSELFICNGSAGNPSNTTAVHGDNYIMITGEVMTVYVTRPNKEGCHYKFGYRFYDWDAKSLGEAPESKSTGNTVNIASIAPAGAKMLKVVITEYDNGGVRQTLRESDFVGELAFVSFNIDVDSIRSDVDSIRSDVDSIRSDVDKIESTRHDVQIISPIVNGVPTFAKVDVDNKILNFTAPPIVYIDGEKYECSSYPGVDYTNISLRDKYGSGTSATRLIFNKNTKEFYCIDYARSCKAEEIAVGGVRAAFHDARGAVLNAPMSVEYIDKHGNKINSENAYTRNLHKDIELSQACLVNKSNGKTIQISICTDTHADILSVNNAITMTNHFRTIDANLFCGDILGDYYNTTQISQFQNALKGSDKPCYVVVGNHDVGNTKYIGACATHEQTYEAFIKPMVDKGWLKMGEYTEGKSYWYHDDETYKVRLIGLYEYDDPMDFDETYWRPISYDASIPAIEKNRTYAIGDKVNVSPVLGGYFGDVPTYIQYSFECVKSCTTNNAWYNSIAPSYKILRGTIVIRQEQAQWFLNTLASTPNEYKVIIAMHNPFSDNAVTVKSKFTQTEGLRGSSFSQNSMQTDFVRNAISAFINRVNYSEEIVMKGDASYLNVSSGQNGNYAYKVEKDFSEVRASFGCIVGGHVHWDLVWKDDSENIYQVTPICATTDAGNSANNDIARPSYDSVSYDCITVLSLRPNAIALVKLGVDTTINAEKRDFEVININE